MEVQILMLVWIYTYKKQNSKRHNRTISNDNKKIETNLKFRQHVLKCAGCSRVVTLCFHDAHCPSFYIFIFPVLCSSSNQSERGSRALAQDRRQYSEGSYLYLTSLFWQTGVGAGHYLACGACSIEWTWL